MMILDPALARPAMERGELVMSLSYLYEPVHAPKETVFVRMDQGRMPRVWRVRKGDPKLYRKGTGK